MEDYDIRRRTQASGGVKRRPWFKFWPADWLGDPKLNFCSWAARGLWIHLLCLMDEGTPRGHLTPKQLAAATPTEEASRLLAELEAAGIFSRTDDGGICSRRMVHDEELSQIGKGWAKRRWTTPNGVPNGVPNGLPITRAEPLSEALLSSPDSSSDLLPISEIQTRKRARKGPPRWKGEIPLQLAGERFAALWTQWLRFRDEEKRKPVTQLSGDKALSALSLLSLERACAAIEHTIAMGWQGIREPDVPRNGSPRTAVDPEFKAMLDRAFSKKKGPT